MNFARSVFCILVLIFVKDFASCDNGFPSYIRRCVYEDNECILKSWNKYLKAAGNPKGLPELGVPGLHNVLVSDESYSVPGLEIRLFDSNVTGFDNIVIDSISPFPRNPKEMNKIEIVAHLESFDLQTRYYVRGTVHSLNIEGNDRGEVTFSGIKLNMTYFTSTKLVDGKEYLEITETRIGYSSERNLYNFHNLLNNPDSSDALNGYLNQNQAIYNPMIKASIEEAMAKHFTPIVAAPFSKFPYSSFFVNEIEEFDEITTENVFSQTDGVDVSNFPSDASGCGHLSYLRTTNMSFVTILIAICLSRGFYL